MPISPESTVLNYGGALEYRNTLNPAFGRNVFKKPPCIMRCASDFEMTCKRGQ